MFVNNLSPILFSIGPLAIRFYSLAYLLGFVASYYLLKRAGSNKWIKNWKDSYADSFVSYSFVGMLIGARFFHVFIYEPSFYFSNPQYILAIWRGGLSFHGALIGMMIATYIFSKKYKVKFYDIADFVVIPTAFFLIFGRIANFINGELYGRITNVSWCVEFANSGIEGCRHPTQLYESFKNVILFSGLLTLWRYRKNLAPGTLFWSFVGGYGLLRFLIMYLRDEPIVFLGMTLSQVFSALMFIVAMYFIAKNRRD